MSYTLEQLPDSWLLGLFSYKEEFAVHWTPVFKELLYHKTAYHKTVSQNLRKRHVYEMHFHIIIYLNIVSLNLGPYKSILEEKN